MAKKTKKNHRRNGSMKIPLAVVAGFFPLASSTIIFANQVGWKGVMPHLSRSLTGWNPDDNRWYPRFMIGGWAPIALGFGVHMIAARLGLNRVLGRMGVPLIRI